MLRADGGPRDDLLADYAFVRLADLISLTSAPVGPTSSGSRSGRSSDLTPASSCHRMRSPGLGFRSRSAREIRNWPFRSDVELRDAVREANVITPVWSSKAGLKTRLYSVT